MSGGNLKEMYLSACASDLNLVVVDHKKSHSSSGSRFFYGELFDGVERRDGSEMAGRWTYQQAMLASHAAGKRFDFSASVPPSARARSLPKC
jgi:hypothetical protein